MPYDNCTVLFFSPPKISPQQAWQGARGSVTPPPRSRGRRWPTLRPRTQNAQLGRKEHSSSKGQRKRRTKSSGRAAKWTTSCVWVPCWAKCWLRAVPSKSERRRWRAPPSSHRPNVIMTIPSYQNNPNSHHLTCRRPLGETQDSQEFSPSCFERSYVPSSGCFIVRYQFALQKKNLYQNGVDIVLNAYFLLQSAAGAQQCGLPNHGLRPSADATRPQKEAAKKSEAQRPEKSSFGEEQERRGAAI